jgi:hypothetical protein
MMQFYRYTLTVRHDAGRVKITTTARSAEAARGIVCSAERCPRSAIERVRRGRLVCDTTRGNG